MSALHNFAPTQVYLTINHETLKLQVNDNIGGTMKKAA